jgi:serine-type D-Ala-D-Ala carboxypeptidase/endopeptidase (penicillin-binding protein 4)
MNFRLALALAILTPFSALAQIPSLQARAEAALAEAPKGTRIGLVVADETGREIVSILPDQRFIPASNTKMVTTATAFATIAGLDQPDVAGGAGVSLNRDGSGFEVVLTGYGDARLSAKPDCIVNCLAVLADAVAARTKIVSSVRADAQAFSDQRWSPGMSWNNIPTESGTAIAAIVLDDNEVPFTVAPGAVNSPPVVTFGPQNGGVNAADPTSTPLRDTFFTISNSASTTAAGVTKLGYDRLPFRRNLDLTGTIASGARPEAFRLGIDDPAYFTAWTFARMLKARGVRVGTTIGTNYARTVPETAFPPRRIAKNTITRLTPPPLAEDIVIINKVSQNLHAELLLRRIGCAQGDCSAEGGLKLVRATLEKAGLPRAAYDFSDGSGMSTYNRISPRGMVTLLRWAQGQPWGKAWRDSFPVGGVDGTIAGRFKGTILEGRIFAKTGGLNATAALSGYMTAKSGKTFLFSILANDIPDDTSARPTMDAALVMIAQSN